MPPYTRARRFIPLWAALLLTIPVGVAISATALAGYYDFLASVPLFAFLIYLALAGLLNRRTVHATWEGVHIAYGPLPFPFRPRRVLVPIRAIRRVFVRHQPTKTKNGLIHLFIAGVEDDRGLWRDLSTFDDRPAAERDAAEIAKALSWPRHVEALSGQATKPDISQFWSAFACIGLFALSAAWALYVEFGLRRMP